MPLEATFSLTPRESRHYVSYGQKAYLNKIYGASFFPKYSEASRNSFDHQHSADELYFLMDVAADPSLDYSTWTNRRTAPRIELNYNLSDLGAAKELALVFGFEVVYGSPRLLIYTSAGLLSDETLAYGDNQFLLEVESLDNIFLYFIHARNDGSFYGGSWYFKGITGYVV